MNRNWSVRNRAAIALPFCLSLWGFAAPVSAKTIVVTTLTDTADPPFNANGFCGTGTISDLPGADGLISLREAIIAANNTKGADTITFAPGLSGGTIMVNFDDSDADTDPDPLPALCGGQTTIKGDLNGDDIPDITLEGMALPAFAPLAGLLVVSSHNTIQGLHVRHFPVGIWVQAGDFPTPGTPGTVEHTTVRNNIVTDSSFHGIWCSPRAITTSSATSPSPTTRSRRNGAFGIFLVSQGAHNVISDATVARNTVSGNTFVGIPPLAALWGADENTLEVAVTDNTVTDNGFDGINLRAGQDNSSHNHVVARIRGNTVERHQHYGVIALAGIGADNFETGTSNNNVLDVRIERNTVASQAGVGIGVSGAAGGQPGGVADGNQTSAVVMHNTVANNTLRGIELLAGDVGLASANTTAVRVAHNTVCDNGTDIIGEGGFSGDVLFPVPNQGTGNVLEGAIFQNTATTVVVEDGVAGNSAEVTQSKNVPCP